jgi:hypothetical protein
MSEADVHTLAEDTFPAFVLMKSNIYAKHVDRWEKVVNIVVDQA